MATKRFLQEQMSARLRMGALSLALLVTVLCVASCYDIGPQKARDQQFVQTTSLSVGGTVVFRDKNGAFFGILADNGGQYEPLNLDPAFHTEGLRIHITGRLDTTHLGKHQWGNPIDLDRVKAQM